MTKPTPIRKAALAATAELLAAELSAVALEHVRRAAVDTDKEVLPRLLML